MESRALTNDSAPDVRSSEPKPEVDIVALRLSLSAEHRASRWRTLDGHGNQAGCGRFLFLGRLLSVLAVPDQTNVLGL